MCRQNWIPAAGLIAFGAGLLAGCCINSCIWTFCVAMASIGAGVWLLHCR